MILIFLKNIFKDHDLLPLCVFQRKALQLCMGTNSPSVPPAAKGASGGWWRCWLPPPPCVNLPVSLLSLTLKASKGVNCTFGCLRACDSGMKTQCPWGPPGKGSSRREKGRESIQENSWCLTRATHSLANTRANVARVQKNLETWIKKKKSDY